LTRALEAYGVELRRKVVVRDVESEIAAQIRRMMAELDLVLVTGGLGPTTDDRTRQAAAAALGRELHLDAGLLRGIEAKFERWGAKMPRSNVRQAEVIEGAIVLTNRRGTAPGMRIETGSGVLFLFPGVPGELRALIEAELEPWLATQTPGRRVETRVLRVACLSESSLEDRLAPVYDEFDAESLSVLASPGDIQVHLRAVGTEGVRSEQLDRLETRIGELLGEALYATGVDASLEGRVSELLRQSGGSLATAESCTAGLLAERLTRIAGSSEYFLGGVVTYTNDLKQSLLGVSEEALCRYGAVSREVVQEMACGVIDRLGSDWGIGISGVAGPGGGTPDKPVGTVHVAVGRRGGETTHRALRLPGDRRRIRFLASQWALDLLRRRLL
jgi:nicotinamide-nucleotide amidase